MTEHSAHPVHLVPKSDGEVGKKEQQPFHYPEDSCTQKQELEAKEIKLHIFSGKYIAYF